MNQQIKKRNYESSRRGKITGRSGLLSTVITDIKGLKESLESNVPPITGRTSSVERTYRNTCSTIIPTTRRSSRRIKKALRRYSNVGSRLIVKFPWMKYGNNENEEDGILDVDHESEEDFDELGSDDEEETITYRRNRGVVHRAGPPDVLSPEEITEKHISKIAPRLSGKTYSENGTSCHQCRQKTLDMKTMCRSGHCVGVRGQFCGPCLKGRYGEDAAVALKDANWSCPPCRGLCNCSICRTRNGQRPTGILAPLAKMEGYSSVLEYLSKAEKANNQDDDELDINKDHENVLL